MKRASIKLLAGTIALIVGGIVFPLLLLVIAGGLARMGFRLNDLAWVFAIVASAWAASEAFRTTFNGLCERWSNDPTPPRIHGWRLRRNVVRST